MRRNEMRKIPRTTITWQNGKDTVTKRAIQRNIKAERGKEILKAVKTLDKQTNDKTCFPIREEFYLPGNPLPVINRVRRWKRFNKFAAGNAADFCNWRNCTLAKEEPRQQCLGRVDEKPRQRPA